MSKTKKGKTLKRDRMINWMMSSSHLKKNNKRMGKMMTDKKNKMAKKYNKMLLKIKHHRTILIKIKVKMRMKKAKMTKMMNNKPQN